MKILIDNGADVNCKANGGGGFTPLAIAVSEGHKESVDLLLKKGADVNVTFPIDSSTTPLHTACAWNQPEIAQILIRNGSELEAKDADGKTPLDMAVELGNKEVAEVLRRAINE